ncbi:MAG: transcriptional repressor [Anaerolineales bacterium]|nr:transcriptional repressor [Anaerolineales bacterium]
MSCTEFFSHILRERGYRITPQRKKIIELVSHGPGHVSVETIQDELDKQKVAVNIATIYRTLEMMVTEGLASKTETLSGVMAYSPIRHGHHTHLICRICGKTIDIEGEYFESLSAEILNKFDFQVDLNHTSIFGTCASHARKPISVPNICSD